MAMRQFDAETVLRDLAVLVKTCILVEEGEPRLDIYQGRQVVAVTRVRCLRRRTRWRGDLYALVAVFGQLALSASSLLDTESTTRPSNPARLLSIALATAA